MSRVGDFFGRLGRASRRSQTSGRDGTDDTPGPVARLSIGAVSIGLGGNEPDRDHDGIPDSQEADSGDSDGGDSGGDD